MASFRTFDDVISYWARKTPDAPALLGPSQTPLDYRALSGIVVEFRRFLAQMGVSRNERVAVAHSGGAEMAAAIIGIACSATAVPFNPAMSAGEFYLHLLDKKVRALAVEKDLPSDVHAAAEKLGIPVFEIIHTDPSVAGKVVLSGRSNAPEASPGAAGEDDLLVVFTTSGTTSYGKTVPLSHRTVIPRVANMTEMMKFTQQDRVLNIMPLFHTGGFSAGLLTTIFAGASFLPVKNNDVDMLFRCMGEIKPTVIAGGYTVFHSIERKAQEYRDFINEAKPSLRMLRTGTGHLDHKIATRLEEIFETPVVEAYGSAETSFMACTGIPPVPRKKGSVGQPDRNRVFVVDSNGEPVPLLEKGEIVVRRESAFAGYENNPDANREAFTKDWYRTGDEGFLDEDGFLFITGRIKEMINRGGVKIIPTEVDQAAMRHEAVREAVSFPLPHQTLGEDIALAIVAEEGAPVSEGELKTFLKTYLVPNKIPSRILFVDEIPKGATGKAQRRKLNRQLETLSQNAVDGVENARVDKSIPANAQQMQTIWQEVLGKVAIGLDENFFALGGDSLLAVDLFLRIEKHLGRRLPRDVLFEAGTIREMAELIESGPSTSCVVPIKPDGSRPPLFFVHPIGGETLGYRDFARYLDADQPFYGIQQFRPDGEFIRFSSIEDMAEHYLEEITRVQPDGPYYLGGHSFGGLVAYLIAQKLAARGEETAFLALLDSYLPSNKRYVSLRTWMAGHYQIWAALPGGEKITYIVLRMKNLAKGFSRMARLKLLAAVNGRIPTKPAASTGGTISNLDINALNVRNFRPSPYPGNAILFRTELPVSLHPSVHEDWSNLVQGGLEVCEISGGHVQIMKEPYVRKLAQELTSRLKKVQSKKLPA